MAAWSPEFIHAFLAGLWEAWGRGRLLLKYILKYVIPFLGQAFIHQGPCDLSLLPSPWSPGKLPETGRPGTPRAASVHSSHPHFGQELSPEPSGPVGSSTVEPRSGGLHVPSP